MLMSRVLMHMFERFPQWGPSNSSPVYILHKRSCYLIDWCMYLGLPLWERARRDFQLQGGAGKTPVSILCRLETPYSPSPAFS